jgi:O-methyltransferase
MGWLTRAGFEAAAHTRLRKYLYYRYDYSFSPRQLGFLVECLDRTSTVPGTILEIGCAYGHTTAFLNKHLDVVGDERDYVCVDTFEGFTSSDTVFEEGERGKRRGEYRNRFADASLRSFQRTMANNGITRVTPVKADIGTWTADVATGVSFCLVDVDLYRPVEASLNKIVPLVAPGGIVVVDDCQEHPLWDGALQAYVEFTAREGIPRKIVEGKFGVIEIE